MSSPRKTSRKLTTDLVRVAFSSVSGRGVFARRRLPRGASLGAYKGRVLSAAEFHARYTARGRVPEYVLQLSADRFVDASDPSDGDWTRFINSNHGTRRSPNVRFTARGHIRVTRPIAVGEELLISYGPAFRFRRDDDDE